MFENRKNIYRVLFDLNKRENAEQKTSEIDFKDKNGNDIEVFRIMTYNKNYIGIQDFIYSPKHVDDEGNIYDSIEEWTLDIPHELFDNLVNAVGEQALLDNFAILKLIKDNNIVADKLIRWFLKRYDIKSLSLKAEELGYINND